jgi:LL-diaminopimelate aminotransferase
MVKKLQQSSKLDTLPPYLFARINGLKAEAYAKKLDVIDLGMGNPDLPTPACAVERLIDSIKNHPNTHRYPQAKGMPRFRKAVAGWMKNRFDVNLDPDNEVVALIGSKEGIAHLCMAYLDPGDLALVCDPAYLVHYNGVVLAGGRVHSVPLLRENKWLPDFKSIPEEVAREAKLIFLNYPNNPTAAVVEDRQFLVEAVEFCKKYEILLVYDNAYSEITFDGYVAPSIFEIPGARDVAVEFHSFSKTFNMAGWRIGWVCGPKKFVYPLEKLKSYMDYGVATFIQLGATAVLEAPQDGVKQQALVYQKRMHKFAEGLNKAGWNVDKTKGSMYLWAPLPDKFKQMDSMAFSEMLLKETGIVVSPGRAFGACGEGYVRISLVTHDNRFHDALLRIKKLLKG